jgi:hypothetical protein
MERLKVIQDAFIELGIKTEIVTDDDNNHLVFKNHNSIIEEALVKELKNAKKELSMIKKNHKAGKCTADEVFDYEWRVFEIKQTISNLKYFDI